MIPGSKYFLPPTSLNMKKRGTGIIIPVPLKNRNYSGPAFAKCQNLHFGQTRRNMAGQLQKIFIYEASGLAEVPS